MKKVFLSISIVLFSIFAFGQDAKYKSLFIYNFTKHIEWPASHKTGDFIIGVYGKPDVAQALSGVTTGKSAGGQKIVVKEFESLDAMGQCHILFVASSKCGGSKFDEIKAMATGKNILLVTERPGLGKKGAAINFIFQAGKIKFELNKAILTGEGLKVSSYLENIAIML